MATYDYACPSCGTVEEHVHGMNVTPEIKCACGTVMGKIFSHNMGGFIMKGGTPTTHYKEKRYRQKRNEEISKKQQERWGDTGPKVTPNIAGHETGTWQHAHQIAKEIQPETGINTETYKALAEKEGEKKIVVATH